MPEGPERCGVVRVKLKFDFATSRRAVWNVFTKDIAKWWPREFYTDPRAKGMALEPKLGGRLYEDWGQGRGRTWHTIVTFDPPRVLEMTGHLFPEYGGPAEMALRLEFSARGKGTRLRLTDSIFGRADKGTKKSFEKGWEALFRKAFAQFLKR